MPKSWLPPRLRASKLEGTAVEVSRKAGVDGRLFGSVTNADVAEALKAKGFAVEKSAVRMPEGPLKASKYWWPFFLSCRDFEITVVCFPATGGSWV
jgi:hypothetical protein